MRYFAGSGEQRTAHASFEESIGGGHSRVCFARQGQRAAQGPHIERSVDRSAWRWPFNYMRLSACLERRTVQLRTAGRDLNRSAPAVGTVRIGQ